MSESEYGRASYLRLTNISGAVHVAFVMGKARVAPLKPVTIPRLELAAAVLAAHVDRMLKREIEIPLMKSVFWTDSTSVLKYMTQHDSKHTLQIEFAKYTTCLRNPSGIM